MPQAALKVVWVMQPPDAAQNPPTRIEAMAALLPSTLLRFTGDHAAVARVVNRVLASMEVRPLMRDGNFSALQEDLMSGLTPNTDASARSQPLPEKPRVDVVISAYNAAAHIEQAITSALAQRGVDVRVFVVDGGSSDETPALIAANPDTRVHLIHDGTYLNTCAARNLGVARGDAPWICYLDADDLWPQDRTATLLAAITDPAQQIAYGHMLTFPDGATVDTATDYPPGDSPLGPAVGTAVFSRSIYERVGELDESLRMGEFVDWMARARSLGFEDVPVPVVALLRRAHANNTTRDLPSGAADYLRVVAAHMARQETTDE